MKMRGRVVLVGAAAGILVACLFASFLTRGSMANLSFLNKSAGAGPTGLVDQSPWQTAAALAPLAVSAEEQELAKEAERLADHEVDQAFATALRLAPLQMRAGTGAAVELQERLTELQGMVKEDQARVDDLTAQIAAATKAGKPTVDSLQDDLDVAKAQLELDTDELNDAGENLARASGDKRGQIQQELTAREAEMKKYDDQVTSGGQVAVVSARRYGTLSGRIGAWFDQRGRMDLLEQAKAKADSDAAALNAQGVDIAKQSSTATTRVTDGVAATSGSAAPAEADTSAKGKLARMARVHALTQIHSILNDRVQTQKQLSAVYVKWIAQLELQHKIVMHLILQSLTWIALVVFFGMLVWLGAQALLDRAASGKLGMDKRSVHTLRTITSLAIQLVTLLVVLLVVFGAPNQVPTILGLATAGLTVVFQDFILAFFGWFVLMGRNGIRVGDWVEINGVGGEVVEIGLFRTALLETGNWTDKGHPTGRRVTFINNFAITGQYFNFSTAGQWMWDEISVHVPEGLDTHRIIEAIHTAVVAETEKDAKEAETEWQSATKEQGLSHFSATPSVDMRPAASGIDIIVRYVTRAGERFDMRNRLYEAVIELLRRPEDKTASTPSR
jgi:small-conductance mechanosensitive channel